MNNTVQEVLSFIEENDVKFIRLAFCDVFGTLKNLSVMASELPRAFEQGICFDASAIKGFLQVESEDLFLFPDPSTLSLLPWRPQQGRVVRFYCDIRHADHSSFAGDGRNILKKAVKRAAERGYRCEIGTECEFYLFQMDEQGQMTHKPHDQAGYLDVAPYDKGENVRREICLTLEEMGIQPETSHHAQGPGQNEIAFKYGDTLLAADNLITFKTVVKTIAARNGLCASFLPKPLPDCSGSGLHMNLSLVRKGRNIFQNEQGKLSEEAEHFIAGVLRHIPEMTAFFNPLVNSYQRFGGHEAPVYLTWSYQSRSQLIRIPIATSQYTRMELRSPDPACNPYLAFTLLLDAGLAGLEKQWQLPRSNDINLSTASKEQLQDLQRLPASLLAAIALAETSSFIQKSLPQKTVEEFLTAKKEEWALDGKGTSCCEFKEK